MGRALERVDQGNQSLIQSINGITAIFIGIGEKAVANSSLAGLVVDFHPIRHHHVVDPLEGVSRGARILTHDVQVLFESSLPVLLTELF